MSKSTRARAAIDPAGRALRRLLEALAEPGARAAASDLDDGALVLLAPRNGVTAVLAHAPAAAGETAVAEGLAEWTREGDLRRLRLTEAGRAWLRRMATPQDPEADPFRAQHARLRRKPLEKGARPTLVNETESPLAWLARRKTAEGRPFLEPGQIEAGERFRSDIEKAQILQRVTANWEAPTASSRRGADAGVAVTELALDARRRLARACDAVGPDLAGLLTDVCGYLKGLETVESERGWPARSAKVVLKIALERLARHYGVASEATGPARSGGLLHWGADDYRPDF